MKRKVWEYLLCELRPHLLTICKVARQTKVRASGRRSRKKQFCVLFVNQRGPGSYETKTNVPKKNATFDSIYSMMECTQLNDSLLQT